MIYLDSCIVIYALESVDATGARARELLSATGLQFAVSGLVVHEALVGPLRDRDERRLADYRDLFDELEMIDIGLPEFLHAARLRAANRGLRTPDALHIAAAQLADCTELWTNDKRLVVASGGLATDVIDRPGASPK